MQTILKEELKNESEEQNKTSNNAYLGKKMRAISWTMKKKVTKKYIKALSEEKVSVIWYLLNYS